MVTGHRFQGKSWVAGLQKNYTAWKADFKNTFKKIKKNKQFIRK